MSMATKTHQLETEPAPPMPIPPDPGEPGPPLPEPIPTPEPDRAALLLRLAELPRIVAEPRRRTGIAGGLVRLRRSSTAV